MVESILHAVLSHDGVVTGLLFTHLLASKPLLLWSCEDPQQLLLSNRVRNEVYHISRFYLGAVVITMMQTG